VEVTQPALPELIYLDLNHWINLSKARIGQEVGAYTDVLRELRVVVASGRAVVPISSTHYMEISRIASAQRRADLALVMGELSKYIALTPRETFLRYQLRRSIAQELGKHYVAPPPVVTGHGFSHAFGQPQKIWLEASREVLARATVHQVEEFIPRLEQIVGFGWRFVTSGKARTAAELIDEALDAAGQFGMLMGAPDKKDPDLLRLGFNPAAAYDVVDAITRREEDLAQQLAADPKWLHRLDDVIEARALYWDLSEDWDQAMLDVWSRVVTMDELGKERIHRIMGEIPIIDIESAIRRANFSTGSHKWRKNDIHDSDFAGSAVTYCDVVLTERHLHTQLVRQGIDRKYKTAILSRPEDLVAHLGSSVRRSSTKFGRERVSSLRVR
jgi:hypothetical protein